jgi:hypothetical protein
MIYALIYCIRSSRLKFLIVSDVSAIYTAAIMKKVLQLQNLQLYNFKFQSNLPDSLFNLKFMPESIEVLFSKVLK